VLKYIYFPTGRDVWLKLASSLNENGIAEPVIWVGDPKLDLDAKKTVINGVVVDFSEVHAKIGRYNLDFNISEYKVFSKINDSPVREKTIKMMDRHDPYGAYRNVDRDAFFKHFVMLSIYLVKKHFPDFLLMAESPHSPFQYTLYEVAKEMGVVSYSFASWSIAPLACLRKGIDGQFLDIDLGLMPTIKGPVFNKIDEFLSKFEENDGDIEPKYIKNQRAKDENSTSFLSKLKSTLSLLRTMASRALKKPLIVERGVTDDTCFEVFEPLIKRYLINKRSVLLRNSSRKSVDLTSVPNTPYVYFPLHYEPERTTNPEGLGFHDQINAILALRAWLPQNVLVIVKEHYSQFTGALQGYKGRSAYFYRLLGNISGVQVVDDRVSSKLLIKNSNLTSVITGTAALEAALLGVPAVIFGNPWFKGSPGVFCFSNELSYCDILSEVENKSWTREDIRKWLFDLAINRSLFLMINPSNKSYFKEIHDQFSDQDFEFDGLYRNLQNLIVYESKRGK
jgi:hypothetical protein